MKAWIPATLVALVLAIGIGAAAYFTIGRSTAGSPSPTPSVDLHSDAAVIAAIRHYYDVEAEARKTGNADLIDAVTLGHASIASQNFHEYVREQAALGKRSVVIANHFRGWQITVSANQATANYVFWLTGHDTSATGAPLEANMDTSKGSYRMTLELLAGAWLVNERDLLQDNVP